MQVIQRKMTKISGDPFFALLMNAESRLDLKWVFFSSFCGKAENNPKEEDVSKTVHEEEVATGG